MQKQVSELPGDEDFVEYLEDGAQFNGGDGLVCIRMQYAQARLPQQLVECFDGRNSLHTKLLIHHMIICNNKII